MKWIKILWWLIEWPVVTRATLEAEKNYTRTQTRRSLINHLRQNRRGMMLLDNVKINSASMPGELTILGDGNEISHSFFGMIQDESEFDEPVSGYSA